MICYFNPSDSADLRQKPIFMELECLQFQAIPSCEYKPVEMEPRYYGVTELDQSRSLAIAASIQTHMNRMADWGIIFFQQQ